MANMTSGTSLAKKRRRVAGRTADSRFNTSQRVDSGWKSFMTQLDGPIYDST